jgi:hypothetical protein
MIMAAGSIYYGHPYAVHASGRGRFETCPYALRALGLSAGLARITGLIYVKVTMLTETEIENGGNKL